MNGGCGVNEGEGEVERRDQGKIIRHADMQYVERTSNLQPIKLLSCSTQHFDQSDQITII